ncbi:hypothetical protein ACFQRC_04665 [Enterovirga sp. GCM10030262]|uniref:hypothetical protein n=1 Tax=Enterovirga sp. GCM10030262 TaxID=3273391 RepID=UPI00361B533C
MFDLEKIQRSAAAMMAALILTSVTVGAAVGPARAVETAPAQYAQAQVADQANA